MSFLTNLLPNPKILLAASIASFSAGVYVHSRIAESTLKSALASQQEALVNQCNEDKAITTEVSREYQDKISALSSRIASLKRVRTTECVFVAKPTGGRDGETSPAVASGKNGIPAGELIDFAGEAEKYRLQLISCQEFVRKERLK